MVRPNVLMSIRPAYAEAILAGTKTFELRRRRPSFSAGTRVVVYSSSPDQQLLGTFEAGVIHEASPARIWTLVAGQAGIDRDAFDTYFAGCEKAYAIEIRSTQRLAPKPLRFRPPQSYLFLRSGRRDHRSVLQWAAAAI
jgi:predicted transcriptional regulator